MVRQPAQTPLAEVGVKLHALLTTGAVPATVPSIDTVTVSPVTPVPEMAGASALGH
jgi:hypothetical protein